VNDLPRWSAVPSDAVAEPARPVVVAFDVDGTITTGDCVVPFLRRVGGTGPLVAGLLRRAGRVVPALARRDRDALKACAAEVVFAGRPMADVDRAGEAFAEQVARSRLRDDTLARLRWHQQREHEVVFVSASFGTYLRPLARRLGVDAVLATELVVGEDDRCTGALSGANCRGAEKVRRLHYWLAERHGERAAVELYAYGDSAGDRQLLADADHPFWAKRSLSAMPQGPS
jgi:phosphatidylglycerophosphatase C